MEKTSFKINPLDINLAKMQFNLIKKIESDSFFDEEFKLSVEKYQSKDPTLDISDVSIILNKTLENKEEFILSIEILNKQKTKKEEFELFKGSRKNLISFIKSTSFFEKAKVLILK